LVDYHRVIQLAQVGELPRSVSVYLYAACRAGESARRIIDSTVVLGAIDSSVILTAVARTRSLSEAILACGISEAGIPALEIVSSVVRADLDGKLRRLRGEVGRVSPSRIIVSLLAELHSIVKRALGVLPG